MAAALTDPDHGYYMTRDPFGAAGDFTTAPEISQMFGELIGLWHLACRRAGGGDRRPRPVLAELGPGRGSLMADALRAIAGVGGTDTAFRVHLVETSPLLRSVQRRRLDGHDIRWHETPDALPRDGPLHIVANEFLDALPVRQFLATPRGWRERLLAWRDGRYEPVPAAPGPAPEGLPAAAAVGRVAELSPAREACARLLARRVASQGGAALLIDFTDRRQPLADTLQAVRGQRRAERFAAAGTRDLASAVDFRALARIAREEGAKVLGPIAQGAFLKALGIDARARALLRRAGPRRAREIAGGRDRLVEGMGEDFRVMALVPAAASFADGFAVPA